MNKYFICHQQSIKLKTRTTLVFSHLFLLSYFFYQFPSSAEPLSATLHDAGLDLLGGDDHQRRSVREGGEAEGNHEDYGSGNGNTVAQLVHQQHRSFPGLCRAPHRYAKGKITTHSTQSISKKRCSLRYKTTS